jgi:hypothetical protein
MIGTLLQHGEAFGRSCCSSRDDVQRTLSTTGRTLKLTQRTLYTRTRTKVYAYD